ncbi:MAG: transposase, partial [Silvibacterium sp.]
MSLGETKEPIDLGTPEYLPLASHTLVLRTRREVREELERFKARRSLLRRTLLPSLLCMGIGLLKTNKSDYIDAEAIAEAVGRPTMRFVPVKSDDQLDLQSLHRVRERWVMRRTAVVNQIRGLLLERGTTLRKGRRYVDQALPGILAGNSAKLSGAVIVLLAELKQELEQLAEKIDRADKSIEKIARENEACRRLV